MKNTQEILATSVQAAIANIKKSNAADGLSEKFLKDPLFIHNIGELAINCPLLALGLGIDNHFIDIIQVLCQISFEAGRLYGRQEIADETVQGMENQF